jgi:PAS domain-containing protein
MDCLAPSCWPFMSEPFDARDRCVTDKTPTNDAGLWLAAIVDSSNDVIISKRLDGVITSWNAAAEKLFGYSEAEAVSQPITLVIPADLHDEENDILRKLRAGERRAIRDPPCHTRRTSPRRLDHRLSGLRCQRHDRRSFENPAGPDRDQADARGSARKRATTGQRARRRENAAVDQHTPHFRTDAGVSVLADPRRGDGAHGRRRGHHPDAHA